MRYCGSNWQRILGAVLLTTLFLPAAVGQTTSPATEATPSVATAPASQSDAATSPASAPTTAIAPTPPAVLPTLGKMIEYPNSTQTLRAYWVTPADAKPAATAPATEVAKDSVRPGIILVHDIFGLTLWTKQQADSLAADGYTVIVPDLYSRLEPLDAPRDAGQAWIDYEKTSDFQVLSDLRAAVSFLAANPAVGEKQPIGTVGYDMGGIYAMMLAAADLRVKAAVNYYGRILYTETTKYRPVSPVEVIFNLKAPLLSFYGDLDPQAPADQVRRLERRLEQNPNNIYYAVVRYPNVGHGFLVETRPGYNAQAAQDAMKRTRAFLSKILHVPPPKPEE